VRGPRQQLGPRPESNRFAFVLGGSIGLLALFFQSAVDFNMHIPANAILAITLMALLTSHLRFTTEAYWSKLRPWSGAVLTLVLFAAGCVLVADGWRSASEQVWLRRAAAADPYSTTQLGFLKKAFAVEPQNPQTAYRIGEALWRQSQEGSQAYSDAEGDYRSRANEAIQWFQRSLKLNRWNGYAYLGWGLCLDWLGHPEESASCFARAEDLDPKGYYMLDYIGLHWVELGDYAAARPWFERSIRMDWHNPVAHNYLQICNLRLREAATNDLRGQIRPLEKHE
jgi:tetratricopeptide (TPR) repeat protein